MMERQFKPYPKPVKQEKKPNQGIARFKNKAPNKPVDERSKVKATIYAKRNKNSSKELIKQLDAWFSRRVRLEECDSNYLAKCVDCGQPVDIRRADCGHYHSRKYRGTRWERKNCGVQMKWHNNMMGDPVVNDGFRNELIRRHGQREFEILAIKKNNFFKSDRGIFLILIEENIQIVEKMLVEKGLKKWW